MAEQARLLGERCELAKLSAGQGRWTLGDLEFFSDFEGGNGKASLGPRLGHASQEHEYRVEVAQDPAADGCPASERRRWFFFGVRAAEPLRCRRVRITVHNLSDVTDLYNLDGHRPMVANLPHAPGWERLDAESTRFVCCDAALPRDEVDELRGIAGAGTHVVLGRESAAPRTRKKAKSYQLSWDHTFPDADDIGTTYFAFCVPYGHGDLQVYLSRLQALWDSSFADADGRLLPDYFPLPGQRGGWRVAAGVGADFRREELCCSREGRRVDLLTVTDAAEASRAKDRRPIALVTARCHPGETPGQFSMFGFLEFVLSDDPRAELLRQRFVFKIVPMLNPDGVHHGHTRANAEGFDLNRFYHEPVELEHEAIFALRAKLIEWSTTGRLMFYCDMHAHAHTRGCILYGNDLGNTPEQAWNVAFANVVQANAPHFDVEGCKFPPKVRDGGGAGRDNCGRAQIAELCRVFHAYTLECNYAIGRLTRPTEKPPGLDEDRVLHPGVDVGRSFKPVPYGVLEWEGVGEGIAVSLLDMHGVNSHSRLTAGKAARSLEALVRTAGGSKIPEPFGPDSLVGEDDESGSEDAGHLCQVWRVVFDKVVVRSEPTITGAIVDFHKKGEEVVVAEVLRGEAKAWVRIVAGGRRNLPHVGDGSETELFMLTDGRAKGLGTLLEPTGRWVEPPEGGSPVPQLPKIRPPRVPSLREVRNRALHSGIR